MEKDTKGIEMKKLITIIIITIIIFLNLGFSFIQPQAQEPYPPPAPTWIVTPINPDDVYPMDITEQPADWCDTLPPEDNVCAWGLRTVDGGRTRWYVTKDGEMDRYPLYNFCIVWDGKFGTNFDTCFDLHLNSYLPRQGIADSGRNIYITEEWLICGGGFVHWDFWMSTVNDEIVYGDIRSPNMYYVLCSFLPFGRRAQIDFRLF